MGHATLNEVFLTSIGMEFDFFQNLLIGSDILSK